MFRCLVIVHLSSFAPKSCKISESFSINLYHYFCWQLYNRSKWMRTYVLYLWIKIWNLNIHQCIPILTMSTFREYIWMMARILAQHRGWPIQYNYQLPSKPCGSVAHGRAIMMQSTVFPFFCSCDGQGAPPLPTYTTSVSKLTLKWYAVRWFNWRW